MTKARETADESLLHAFGEIILPALFWLGPGCDPLEAQTTYKMIVDPLATSARAPGLL